jgi:hypothetical protein
MAALMSDASEMGTSGLMGTTKVSPLPSTARSPASSVAVAGGVDGGRQNSRLEARSTGDSGATQFPQRVAGTAQAYGIGREFDQGGLQVSDGGLQTLARCHSSSFPRLPRRPRSRARLAKRTSGLVSLVGVVISLFWHPNDGPAQCAGILPGTYPPSSSPGRAPRLPSVGRVSSVQGSTRVCGRRVGNQIRPL